MYITHRDLDIAVFDQFLYIIDINIALNQGGKK